MGLLRKALQLEGGGMISLVGAGGKTSLMFRLARELSEDGDTVLTTTTTRIYTPDPSQSQKVIVAASVEEIQNRAAADLKGHRHITAAAGRIESQNKLTGFAPAMVDAFMKCGLFHWIIVEADGAAGRPLKTPEAHEPVIPGATGWLISLAGLSVVGKPFTDQWVHRPKIFSEICGLSPGAEITASAVACLLMHPQGAMKNAPRDCRRLIFLNQADAPGGLAAGRKISGLLLRKGDQGIQRVIVGQVLAEPPLVEFYDLSPDR